MSYCAWRYLCVDQGGTLHTPFDLFTLLHAIPICSSLCVLSIFAISYRTRAHEVDYTLVLANIVKLLSIFRVQFNPLSDEGLFLG